MDKELNFLIVDDLASMRKIVRNLLRDLGYTNCEEAADGHAALAMMKRHRFDMVITDWVMPGMDGIELSKSIRLDAAVSAMPILMVSAETKREQILLAAQSGINGYLIKPFSAANLETKINKILNLPQTA
ncbi:MAG: response regulator [Pseudomonadota bacterium]|nr:response regulator [Pseudomonadota bacterium]